MVLFRVTEFSVTAMTLFTAIQSPILLHRHLCGNFVWCCNSGGHTTFPWSVCQGIMYSLWQMDFHMSLSYPELNNTKMSSFIITSWQFILPLICLLTWTILPIPL
jgi:hypothetical protein